MVNFIVWTLGGLLMAYLQPFSGNDMYTVIGTDRYNRDVMQMDPNWFTNAFFYFGIGFFVTSVVRFVPPKTEQVIALLGTWVIGRLKTGIRLTLPFPFGLNIKTVPTAVQDMPLEVQVLTADEMPIELPTNLQWYVQDTVRYAVERKDPDEQTKNLATAAVRSGGRKLTLDGIYKGKDEILQHAREQIQAELESFGVGIKELVLQDPILRDSTADKMASIREAEFDLQAAEFEAKAVYKRMVGHALAEAESTRLKGGALANFRMLIAEGNAAAIALMQGKVAVEWINEEVEVEGSENGEKKTVKVAKFVAPAEVKEGEVQIPEIAIAPTVILDFFKVVDGNDAIRDAASKPGTTVVIPSSVGGSDAIPASLLGQFGAMMDTMRANQASTPEATS